VTARPVVDDPAAAAAVLAALPSRPAGERAAALEALLRHRSATVRDAAVRMAAAALPLERVVGYLRDGEDHVLRNAGLEILKARGRDGVALAETLLADRDPDVVIQAVLVLDHIGDPRSLQALRAALGHPNPNVVQAAIVAVGHHGGDAAVEDLVPFLTADLWLQAAAVEALGDLRHRSAVAPLAGLLPDPVVGALAAGALARIGGPLAFASLAGRWLADGADEETLGLLAHIAEGCTERLDPPDGLVPALGARLAAGGGAGQSAARCLLALGPTGHDRDALHLLAAAWSEQAVLPACLRRRADLVGDLLRAQGAQRGWGFRLAAREPAAVPSSALAEALERQQGYEHADALVEALAAFDGPDLGHRLLALYGRLPREVRAGWGAVLRRHEPALRAALRQGGHADAPARVIAAAVGTPAEAEALLDALAVEDRLEALGHLADRPDVLRRLPWQRWLRVDPGAHAGPAALAARSTDLRHLAPAVRDLAAARPLAPLVRLLGCLGDRRSVALLVELAETGEPGLRPVALLALGALGGPEARRALRRAARSMADGQRFAWRGLAMCRTAADLPLFREAAGHPDWHVRMVAADVLAASAAPRDRAVLFRLGSDPSAPVADRARAGLPR
jgi:HEAT repeat protein